jgi:subtilase family serine protease
MYRHRAFAIVLLILLAVAAPLSGTPAGVPGGFHPLAHPLRVRGSVARIGRAPASRAAPAVAPTDAECRAAFGVPCYSPQQMQTAYNVAPLLNAGYTGAGQTIVIVDAFGSPTIQQDLATFDGDYGLPAPPSFQVLAPLGTAAFDPTNTDMVQWAIESALDVEWAHAIAPGAAIVLLTSPVDETQGVQGMPQFLQLEQYALAHHLGGIISQSWGATEETLTPPAGRQVVEQFEALYRSAARDHVTVLAAAGDYGSANFELDSTTFYPFPTVNYPASSPWVTAVGGTTLTADPSGTYQSEVAWNDNSPWGVPIATGGGVSALFGEPSYQAGLNRADRSIPRGHRGLPDVAYNADPYGSPIPVYLSFLPQAGYYLVGGTSEGSPQWAGLVAVGNQLAGHPLGFLNPSLYRLAPSGAYAASFHDITSGNNSNEGVPGFSAAPGWDPTTGWGSPNAANLLPDLIAAQR